MMVPLPILKIKTSQMLDFTYIKFFVNKACYIYAHIPLILFLLRIAGIHGYYEDGQLILLATDIGNHK